MPIACDNGLTPVGCGSLESRPWTVRMTLSKNSLTFLRAAAIACVLVAPIQTQAKDSPEAATAGAASAPSLDIYNFGQVSTTYFRGAELKGTAASGLAARGVKMVIDLRSDGDVKSVEADLVSRAGMKYVRIPMTTREAPTSEQVSQFLALVTNPANQPVYVHCVEGRHRTGVMTAIYRMTVDGWTPDRAFGEMKDYKFGMDFLHPEFKQFVFAFHPAAQTELAERATVSGEGAVPSADVSNASHALLAPK